MLVTCSIDARNWSAAQRIIMQHSKTLPGEALPRAVAFVVREAKARTPFTTIGQIDSELSVISTPMLSTRGARKGLPLKSGKNLVNVVEGGLATKIVLARLHLGSKYNTLTDMKYALDRANFSLGGGVAGFWAKVEETAERMAKSRHSSTHFLQVTWNAVLNALAPLVPATYQGAVRRWAGGDDKYGIAPDLGRAQMAGAGTGYATLTIENRAGMDDRFPNISKQRNEAAHRLLVPALQTAIDANFDKQMELINRNKWLDNSSSLRMLGVSVMP